MEASVALVAPRAFAQLRQEVASMRLTEGNYRELHSKPTPENTGSPVMNARGEQPQRQESHDLYSRGLT